MNSRAWFKKVSFPIDERGVVLVTGLLIVLVGLYFKVLQIPNHLRPFHAVPDGLT